MDVISKLMEMFKKDAAEDLSAKIEAESVARRKRNEERIEAIKKEMGEKWVLHPSHRKTKLEEPRPV